MLTRMTEDDWAIVLEVFRAVRSRRGDKGRDDRRFLEALHYFTVHNISWRALPAEFGPSRNHQRRPSALFSILDCGNGVRQRITHVPAPPPPRAGEGEGKRGSGEEAPQ
jgi:transposase